MAELAAHKDRLVCMLEPVEVNTVFDGPLPLHVTVQPWFRLGTGLHQSFENALQNRATEFAAFDIVGGEEAQFDPEENGRVRKLQSTGHLWRLHQMTAGLIANLNGQVESEWVGDRYNPHVRYLGAIGLQAGETATLRAMQLIRKDTESGQKIVEREYRFTKNNGGNRG